MPARGASKAWLHLGGRLGRVAGGCLVAQNFLYIFAPLFFLLDLGRFVNPRDAGGQFVAQASDAGLFLAVGDIAGMLGFALLATALAALIAGHGLHDALSRHGHRHRQTIGRRARPRSPSSHRRARSVGISDGRVVAATGRGRVHRDREPREAGVGTLDSAILAGGWGIGAAVLLCASLAFLAFALIQGGPRDGRLACPLWAVFGAVQCLGVAPFAAVIEAAGEADRNPYTLTIGLGVRILLLPVLAVLAYRELLERLPGWEQTGTGASPRGPSRARAPAALDPPPPPPEFDPLGLPPPPAGE